jgi:hypothetical protein
MFIHIQNFYNSLVRFVSKYLFIGFGNLHYQISGGITGFLAYFAFSEYFGTGLIHTAEFQNILLMGYSMFGITTLVDTLRASILVRFRREEPKEKIVYTLQELLREYLYYSGLIQAGYYLGAIEFIYLVAVLHVPLIINLLILYCAHEASEYWRYFLIKVPIFLMGTFLSSFYQIEIHFEESSR